MGPKKVSGMSRHFYQAQTSNFLRVNYEYLLTISIIKTPNNVSERPQTPAEEYSIDTNFANAKYILHELQHANR